MDNSSFLGWCFLAGALGAWAMSFFIHLYNAIRYPEMLGDGQYVFLFLLTLPMGWLLGSIVGAVVAYLTVPPPYPAVWKVILLILGGILGSPLVIALELLLLDRSLILFTIALPVELLTRRFR
jgi:hypothetical protein